MEHIGTGTSDSSGSGGVAGMTDCILYLLAKCCIDLELYGEAEEHLLQNAKQDYAQYKKFQKKQQQNNNGPTPESERTTVKTFEEWLGDLSPVHHPNAVPNGAAGFHLLGLICQRTMRNKKAKVYHELALKFDPMLWMSYDALCEMGAALDLQKTSLLGSTTATIVSSSLRSRQSGNGNDHGEEKEMDGGGGGDDDDDDDADTSFGIDPVSIFGVVPEALTHIPATQGGYGAISIPADPSNLSHEEMKVDADYTRQHQGASASPFSLNHSPIGTNFNETMDGMSMMDVDPNMTMTSNAAAQGTHAQRTDDSFKMGGVAGRLSFGAASSTPMAGNVAGSETPGMRGGTSASLFHNNLNLSTIRKPSAATGIKATGVAMGGNKTNNSRRSSGFPSTTLFNTPIETAAPLLTYTPRNQERQAEQELQVLRRARQVAGRRYYEPSPETTPPNRIRTAIVPHSSLKLSKKKMRRRFVGAEYDELYDLDDSIAGTVTGIGGGGKGAASGSGGRFLFDHSVDLTTSSPANMSVMGMDTTTTERDWTGSGGGVRTTTKKKGPSSKKLSRVREDESSSSKEQHESTTPSSSSTSASNYQTAAASSQQRSIRMGSGEDGGVQYILELLCTFGAAQRLLCAFKCKEAIQILHTLPHAQFQTGYVQHQLGRAYFYSVDYANAQRALETMQEVEPHRMNGLELLSTTYYLLKKEVELSNLAQRAVEFDKMAAETWCIVGNCFSQQKEHKTALAFLRRAIQLNPRFTYAHTLSGHEYVANEDFDQAVASFRTAIRVDERHYNAWNGLGEIYFRQEKYDLAESHFRKALMINPQGSVIRCNLGQAQHANGKHELALQTLALVDSRNPQAQFQRANILISMDRLTEALRELEKVRDTAPKEGSIHFAMGRVLKKLGRPEKAMRCFLTALDLDPKENTLIKSAIDRLDEPDIDEDVSAF